MYNFVHIPKTGGISAVRWIHGHPFINSNAVYSSVHHRMVCHPGINCFTIVREPISRIISGYRFWKYGSTQHAAKGSGTLRDFVESGDVHARTQIHWIPRHLWHDVIVVKYQKDLEEPLKRLFEYLKLEAPKKPFQTANVSNGDPVTLDSDDLEWLRDHYREDFELWDAVNAQPELFLKVL